MNEPRVLSSAEVAEKLARADQATPGPWARGVECDEETGEEIGDMSIHGKNYEQTWNDEVNEASDTVCVLGFSAHNRHAQNLEFIAASRTDVPALCASHELLRAEVGHLRGLLKKMPHTDQCRIWGSSGKTPNCNEQFSLDGKCSCIKSKVNR